MKRWRELTSAAYILMAVVTFGHAAGRCDRCTTGALHPANDPLVVGVFAATFWPLYWSWVAFDEAGQ